jgi:hypothetical protein
MVVNFRAREINRGTYKLIRTPILIKKNIILIILSHKFHKFLSKFSFGKSIFNIIYYIHSPNIFPNIYENTFH